MKSWDFWAIERDREEHQWKIKSRESPKDKRSYLIFFILVVFLREFEAKTFKKIKIERGSAIYLLQCCMQKPCLDA